MNQQVTGKPSIDKPWMKYYPSQLIQGLTIPEQTVYEYLMERCPGDDVAAIHYYGRDIRWRELKEQVDLAARSLRAIGFGEGDQIPIFLRAVPEFIYLLLAAEKIGASVLCRDNTLEENIAAVKKSGAKMIIAHDFLSHEELNRYRKEAGIRGAVLLSPIRSAMRTGLPDYCWNYLESLYTDYPAYGPYTMSWEAFMAIGNQFTGKVEAPKDIDRPLFRAYTSGSTGPSKQVIHSAHTMIGNMHQMNFYGASSEFRPTWMVTQLTPSLVAVVVAMLLFLPLGTLSPLMTYNWFGGDGYAASGVEAAAGIGLLIGSLFMLVWGGGKRLVTVLVVAGAAIGAGCIAAGLLPQSGFFAFVGIIALIFAATAVFNAPILPLMQKRIPQESFGRAMGIFGSLTALASPVGLFVAGPAADMLGVNCWFVVCGTLLCVAMGLSLLSRSLRALDDQDVNDPSNAQEPDIAD